ncbi:ASST-domain-containing protein [Xylariales sp. PMI_506]|nr:ASST-domain-containing protein [Xylariales sp. PMI_506]
MFDSSWAYFLVCIIVAFRLAVADEFKFNYIDYNNASFGIYPDNRHKATRTKTPVLQVTTWEKDAVSKSGSHIFIRHNGAQDTWGHQDASPLILRSDDLTAVYVNRSFPIVFNVRVQENYGQKYLTFYGDRLVDYGLGNGYCHIYDTSYREVYKVGAVNLRVKADLHECELTGKGTVIVSAYETGSARHPIGARIRPGTRPTSIRESIFQEIDLETKQALFTWRASEHVDIHDSFEGQGTPWDFFHINTVQKTEDGNYLVSARHMHSIYLINGKTGDIMWTMGGKKNQFKEIPPEKGVVHSNPVLTFGWQHHSRFYKNPHNNNTEMTFFDNHRKDVQEHGCTQNCSRGLHIRLDTESNPPTVQLIREYQHPASLVSQSQGSVQILDNGNVFIGWGRAPSFTEHTPEGETVLDVQFSPWRSPATHDHGLDNYRAFKQDWKATPYWPPDIAAETRKGLVTTYVSWNGATEVAAWVIYAAETPEELTSGGTVVAEVPRAGFETEVALGEFNHPNGTYIRAEPIDSKGRTLGSTGIVNSKTHKVVKTTAVVATVIEEVDEEDEIDDTEADDAESTTTDPTTAEEDDDSSKLTWDLSQEDADWETIRVMFTILGMSLSVCCLAYAIVLKRSREAEKEQHDDVVLSVAVADAVQRRITQVADNDLEAHYSLKKPMRPLPRSFFQTLVNYPTAIGRMNSALMQVINTLQSYTSHELKVVQSDYPYPD